MCLTRTCVRLLLGSASCNVIPVKLLESPGGQLIFCLLVLGTPERGVLASLSFASFCFVYFHAAIRGAYLGSFVFITRPRYHCNHVLLVSGWSHCPECYSV